MKEKAFSLFIAIVAGLLLAVVLHNLLDQEAEREQTLKKLRSIDSHNVTAFAIYPRVIRPFGPPRIFHSPAPLIDEFFDSLQDIHSYRYSHDTVNSPDHSWFIEIRTPQDVLQMSFHIPSGSENIVAVELGKWKQDSSIHYGYIQSRLLFQWFQKYRMKWLQDSES
jgi:hypothetical protein